VAVPPDLRTSETDAVIEHSEKAVPYHATSRAAKVLAVSAVYVCSKLTSRQIIYNRK
jgi:hypothetical protein